jgi:hypothetical protein
VFPLPIDLVKPLMGIVEQHARGELAPGDADAPLFVRPAREHAT